MEPEKDAVLTALRQTIDEPTLANARGLESVLRRVGMPAKVFGRLNQKSSIDAAAESDRGITERIANAFDASVTAARRLSGMHSSDASLTPLNAAQRFLNPDRDACDWRPVEKSVDFGRPCIQFWPEDEGVDRADVDGRGYGSVTLSCAERMKNPATDPKTVGVLVLSMQCTDGRLINAAYLEKYRDALGVGDVDCAYWGQASERDGSSVLTVEINVSHPQLQAMIRACSTSDELVQAKERVVQDIVLDCYQHCFRLDDLPEIVHAQVVTEPEDLKRAAEICLNYDKALRMAMLERKIVAKTQ